MERRATITRSRLLLISSILLLAASVALLTWHFAGATGCRALSVGGVKSLEASHGSYRSINNWKTVEETTFRGVAFGELLRHCGVTDPEARIKIIAPDGYFWPPVNENLTVRELNREGNGGLVPLLAYQMNGKPLDPEPDGTGPLRYVEPQYSPEEVNKPSWVSNVRLIEVGPLRKGLKKPQAGEVPVDEVWVYGNVSESHPVNLYLPLSLAMIGLVVLAMAFYSRYRSKHRGQAERSSALLLILLLLLVPPVTSLSRCSNCTAQTNAVFSMGELRSMPSFSGHYTFLKQQPPYTYYEADYTGVPISYLIQKRLNLTPSARSIVVRSTDGYTASLSIDQVSRTYPGGLKVIIAYAKAGASLVGDEGPLRLIVPQSAPGTRDAGGDANTPLCARMVFAVEVSPVPAGVSVPGPGSIPSGSLAVYGSVAQPSGPSGTQTQTQSQRQAAAAQQQAQAGQPGQVPVVNNAIAELINANFGGSRVFAAWITGTVLGCILPGRAGALLRLAFCSMRYQ